MKKERDNNPHISLSASDGIPQVSFSGNTVPRPPLTVENYDVDGNDFTSYCDDAHRLIFILDRTLDSRKPNTLLVINHVDDRKWDDILVNDYGVDLEMVRPKKDNKYQKLDIEYGGLSIYNNLINEFKAGRDLSVALANLSNFRNAAARRAAADRLESSEDIIAKSRDTISKTGETLRELQSRIKKLREKLVRHKKEVGKEPTKQSAAKILKAESQMDAVNEKLRRSKKRLKNAQRRLSVAEDDAQIARKILGQKEEVVQSMPVKNKEKKAINMADEVKPLFDQDPEILDEKIAFKPIDFKISQQTPQQSAQIPEPVPAPVPESTFKPIADVPPAPLSFTPPRYQEESVEITETVNIPPSNVTPPPSPEPVPTPAPPTPVEQVRPVSPITGAVATPVSDNGRGGRPAALYYIMLLILIALSIFTLWLYQKNAVDVVPELVAASQPPILETAPDAVPVPETAKSPFIQVELAQPAPQPVIVEEPVVIPETPLIAQPEPVQYIEPEPEVQLPPQNTEIAEPEYRSYNAPAPAAVPTLAPAADVTKPAYDVSTDRTFVADEEYDTDYEPDDGYYDAGYGDQYTEHHEERSGEYYDEQYEEYYE